MEKTAPSVSVLSSERLAELIRVAIRSARDRGDKVTENELIGILEEMDQRSTIVCSAGGKPFEPK